MRVAWRALRRVLARDAGLFVGGDPAGRAAAAAELHAFATAKCGLGGADGVAAMLVFIALVPLGKASISYTQNRDEIEAAEPVWW